MAFDKAFQGGHQHDGDQAGGKAVVVQIESSVKGGGADDYRGVEHTGDNAGRNAKLSGDGRKTRGKDGAHLHSRRGGKHVIEKSGSPDAQKYRQIVACVDAESGEAEGSQDGADNGAGQIAAYEKDVGGADEAHDSHID